MQIVVHRRNTRIELQETPRDFGVEIDLRSWNGRIVLQHEPFMHGELLEEWMESYFHRLLILNVKEEGLESRLVEIMREFCVENFFFLDQSFPFLVKHLLAGERRCAIRVSEYEGLTATEALAGRGDWVWIDHFTGFPLSGVQAREIQERGFKLCAVSPELHGDQRSGLIDTLQQHLMSQGIILDAVCTKYPNRWLISDDD